MSRSRRFKFVLAVLAVTLMGAVDAAVEVTASNNLPNPFHLSENWAQIPPGIQWGQVISVEPDAHGNIWVFHRSDPAILEFDASGKFLKSFGAGMFVQAHGLAIDRDGNIWVTDAAGKGRQGAAGFQIQS